MPTYLLEGPMRRRLFGTLEYILQINIRNYERVQNIGSQRLTSDDAHHFLFVIL